MKKGDIITGKIEELRFPNKGILWTVKGDGTPAAVIVKNTLPGQKVEARITKKRSGGAEASLVRIVSKAPAETTPSCPVFSAIREGAGDQGATGPEPFGERLRRRYQQLVYAGA